MKNTAVVPVAMPKGPWNMQRDQIQTVSAYKKSKKWKDIQWLLWKRCYTTFFLLVFFLYIYLISPSGKKYFYNYKITFILKIPFHLQISLGYLYKYTHTHRLNIVHKVSRSNGWWCIKLLSNSLQKPQTYIWCKHCSGIVLSLLAGCEIKTNMSCQFIRYAALVLQCFCEF